MQPDQSITEAFQKFAGREFPMSYELVDDPKHGKIGQFKITDRNDATVNEMTAEAGKHGLKMAFTVADIGCGYVYGDKTGGEVEALLEKGSDNKWRVGNSFKLNRE